ncbi:LLM class F420-dependent oxidoreductase [Paractinoplanes lichenicola]|uniref:LLM class F420-dependent oxidoreductase n=1 Tax=Paractinoplanes lichenicola TaxID=2802976 RepID=A0ABS1W641_9ACTN|nr:LLM class F420-dependent oxidoreductase [Actinoplanes lichenicola]MBL7262205.1 LLM class F420-dependent oxidoreductase [Actinoplanes lichenicola]
MSVRFGVFVPQGWKMDLVEIADPVEQYEAMTEVARVADAGPWDAIWLYDHFHTVPEPTLNSVFECWTATSTLARDTSRVRIGQMVGCNGYRQPSLYAKIASTVDVASHGRLIAGLGAGWYEHEWKAYGYEWKDVPQRMGEFREAVEIIHKMWTEDRPVFQGKHYSIDEPINQPRRKPDFWLGGGGEKVTLKLVAQYADGCNVGGGDPEVVRHKLGVLREHCDRLGRDYDTITKSTTIELDLEESTADTIARVERAAEAGADYVLFYIPRVAYDHAPLLRLAEELVPQFR